MERLPTLPRELESVSVGALVEGVLLGLTAAETKAAPESESVPILKTSSERVSVLRSMSYDDYMRTVEWRRTSEKVQERDGGCIVCRGTNWLNAHHLTYERLGREWWSDLVTLCHPCHYTYHRRMPDQHEPKDLR